MLSIDNASPSHGSQSPVSINATEIVLCDETTRPSPFAAPANAARMSTGLGLSTESESSMRQWERNIKSASA
ncbi:MAG: hypothetical protein ACREPE_11730 [Lysobacter sp.]